MKGKKSIIFHRDGPHGLFDTVRIESLIHGLFDPVRIESLKGQREGGSIPLKSKKEDMTMWIGYRTRAKEATHKTRLRGRPLINVAPH